jgi:hypothetical protein
MPHPLRAFLSYRRRDADEAAELERQLALRGISLWRDVNDLPLGGLTEPEIRRGIAASDAFVLYLTPGVFASRVIWEIEVPAAHRRARTVARRRRRYPIVPVFRGVSPRELGRTSAQRLLPTLPTRNGAFVPVHRGGRATARARREACAAVATRLLRSLLPNVPRGPVTIFLRSFPSPGVPRRTLDMNWADAVDIGPAGRWDDDLIPAMRDVKAELARAGRHHLEFFVQTRLAAALLGGMTFPLASAFDITVTDRHGRWPAREGGAVLIRDDARSSGQRRAVLEVSLAQDAGARTSALAKSLGARLVRLTPPRGPSRSFDPRPNAGAIAQQVGDVARELRREGLSDLHLVYSGPAALAFLMGRQLHAVGRVRSYYRAQRGDLRESLRFDT